jgi:hypothetical protein
MDTADEYTWLAWRDEFIDERIGRYTEETGIEEPGMRAKAEAEWEEHIRWVKSKGK